MRIAFVIFIECLAWIGYYFLLDKLDAAFLWSWDYPKLFVTGKVFGFLAIIAIEAYAFAPCFER